VQKISGSPKNPCPVMFKLMKRRLIRFKICGLVFLQKFSVNYVKLRIFLNFLEQLY